MASGEEQRFDERRKTQLLRLHRSGRDRKLSRGTPPGRVELFYAWGAPRSSPVAVLEFSGARAFLLHMGKER